MAKRVRPVRMICGQPQGKQSLVENFTVRGSRQEDQLGLPTLPSMMHQLLQEMRANIVGP